MSKKDPTYTYIAYKQSSYRIMGSNVLSGPGAIFGFTRGPNLGHIYHLGNSRET